MGHFDEVSVNDISKGIEYYLNNNEIYMNTSKKGLELTSGIDIRNIVKKMS